MWVNSLVWASENAHELDRLGYHLESLVNLTTSRFSIMRPELQAARLTAIQNRVVHDMLLAREGGVYQMIGEHCCTIIPQGEGNLTILVEHLKELSGDLAREHQPDSNWDPFGWVQSLFGVMGATIFQWLIYGLVIFFAVLFLIVCAKKLCCKVLDTALTMPLLVDHADSEDDDGNL